MRNWRKSDNRLEVKDAVNFNKHRKPARQYQEGDLVRLARQAPHDGKSQKLSVKYQGPYRILKVLRNDRFVVEDDSQKGRRYEAVVSIDKIQPWMSFCRELESDESSNSVDDSD